MAENYLITGYWGEPHVTSENDRGFNAAIFGAGRFVLPVGEQFRAEYIGNNTVRIHDGKLIDNGAVAGIPAGEYIDLAISGTGQGKNRNDLIIFQYSKDASTQVESGVFKILSGEETSGTAADPKLSQQDILTNTAMLDQMPMWRVPVSGSVISAPVQLFEVAKNISNAGNAVVEATSSDGVAYSATVPGVSELYAGLEITIIPKKESTSETITLDVNGLGAKNVRLPLSSNTTTLVMPAQPNYYTAGRPVKLRYDAMWINKGAWVVAERQRTSANDLYGSVPVENGGTGADNPEEARANLGAAPDGYGLGTVHPPTIDSTEQLDACHTSGFYRYVAYGTTLCGISFNFATLIVYPIYDYECVQELRPINSNHCLRRFYFDGAWSDWELVGMVMEILWTNASPTSDFAAQTISMDLSKYKAVYVQSVRSTDDQTVSGATLAWVDVGSNYLIGTTDQYVVTRRKVAATSGGITFSDYSSANTSNGTSNEIPFVICGISGISW